MLSYQYAEIPVWEEFAAGVASNVERMARMADSTGIDLDERMAKASQEVRETLNLGRFRAFKESD